MFAFELDPAAVDAPLADEDPAAPDETGACLPGEDKARTTDDAPPHGGTPRHEPSQIERAQFPPQSLLLPRPRVRPRSALGADLR
jgi:hypothetical protein